MNHKLILRILSRVSYAEAALLLLSAFVALLYGEAVVLPYLLPVAALALLGFLMSLVKTKTNDFYAREGFMAVAISWIYLSIFGCLPFLLSGAIPSFIDALFETISGFTTTGATILTDVEAMPHGLLFWRSLTHWIGGMGVLVFLMAVVPLAGHRSMHLMRAESPGPTVGKLVPRIKSSASILYGIYCVMTLVQFLLLLLGGMPLFDSITTAFSTAGTGGFSVRNAGILAYNSVYAEVIITVFALLFGINFNLYYLVLLKRPLEALKSEELRWYLGIFAGSSILMAINILPLSSGMGDALLKSTFQSASLMSSTGFANADYLKWPIFSQTILTILMMIGACAGSTGGGFKISRLAILLKSIRREISRIVHPRVVSQIKFENKTVDAETIHSVLVYLACYVVLATVSVLLISLNGFDNTTSFTATISALNNVGPGLGLVGPMDNFSIFSGFSKCVLSLLMLFGRLEIFPMILLFSPAVWRRK